MNIGDMVVRSYSWHAIVPGIIIHGYASTIRPVIDGSRACDLTYTENNYIVHWSDGTCSKEVGIEIEPIGPFLEDHAAFSTMSTEDLEDHIQSLMEDSNPRTL